MKELLSEAFTALGLIILILSFLYILIKIIIVVTGWIVFGIIWIGVLFVLLGISISE